MKSALAPLALLALATPLAAQDNRSLPPVAANLPAPALPPSTDVPYPGVIAISVDASAPLTRAIRTVQTFPVDPAAREIVLVYPKWLPGNHGPTGPIQNLGDIRFESGGKVLRWSRVTGEPYAYRVSLPGGGDALTAYLTYTTPASGTEWRTLITPAMANVQWEKMTLYPAGHAARRIRVAPSLTLPEGWQAATALRGATQQGRTLRWAETDYETLVDSPVFAGAHSAGWELGQNVHLTTFADEPRLLAAPPEMLPAHRKLVAETTALMGTRPFDRYDFLVGLTKELGGIGLEHHRSSENTFDPNGYLDWKGTSAERELLPHEFVHSWNGKHRRPAGLWAPDYHTPTDPSLLWVYEGQTEFWGKVLAARSGLVPKEITLGNFASDAAYYSVQPGRAWRSLEDTTLNPATAYRKPQPFNTLSRGTDYYAEAALVWLEVDQILRRGTRGQRGLDDFARSFFAGREGDWGVRTYQFGDVVAALDAILPYDWASFLDARFRQPGQPAPVTGIAMAGYKLVWKDEPNPYDKQGGAAGNFAWSLGLNVGNEGAVTSVIWDSPAFKAGLIPGTTLLAVDGFAFSRDRLTNAVKAAKGTTQPIRLTVKRGERFDAVDLAWDGGLRFPWLEPAGKGEQALDRLLAPRSK